MIYEATIKWNDTGLEENVIFVCGSWDDLKESDNKPYFFTSKESDINALNDKFIVLSYEPLNPTPEYKLKSALNRLENAFNEARVLWDEIQDKDVQDALNEFCPFDDDFDDITLRVENWVEKVNTLIDKQN